MKHFLCVTSLILLACSAQATDIGAWLLPGPIPGKNNTAPGYVISVMQGKIESSGLKPTQIYLRVMDTSRPGTNGGYRVNVIGVIPHSGQCQSRGSWNNTAPGFTNLPSYGALYSQCYLNSLNSKATKTPVQFFGIIQGKTSDADLPSPTTIVKTLQNNVPQGPAGYQKNEHPNAAYYHGYALDLETSAPITAAHANGLAAIVTAINNMNGAPPVTVYLNPDHWHTATPAILKALATAIKENTGNTLMVAGYKNVVNTAYLNKTLGILNAQKIPYQIAINLINNEPSCAALTTWAKSPMFRGVIIYQWTNILTPSTARLKIIRSCFPSS
jgi:hypothetical protein